jgi:hypothetical protein
MSGSEINTRRVSTWDETMTKRQRDTVECWRTSLSYIMTTQARHYGFPIPELDPYRKEGETKLSIETGGWIKIKDAKTFVNRNGYLKVVIDKREEAYRRNRRYVGLAPYNERGHSITTNDMMQVIVHSDKNRYRCMCQVNPYAGIKIPHWFACKHGHSLKVVNPMRTSLLIMSTPELDMIPFIGEPAHKANDGAMPGILAQGLRSDPGGEIARTGIMCDPYGPNEDRTNTFTQRERGNVHVVVHCHEWWIEHGRHRLEHPDVAVYCLITGAGALLFANVDPYTATVLPMSCIRSVWMLPDR